MGSILTNTSDYDAIRARLGVDTTDLPDTDIVSLGLLTLAEAMITNVVTDYASILAGSGNDKTFLRASTLCLCAALAVRKLELQRGQSFSRGTYSESATKVDWSTLRDELLAESAKYMLMISTRTHTRQTLLIASGPTSSAAAWPSVVDRWLARIRPHVVTWLSNSGQRQYTWEQQP